METKPLYKTSMKRDESGQFAPNQYGEKKLRSMKLTDHAWNTLEARANEKGMSRTDIIEEFTRTSLDEREIVLKALRRFIELKQESFGNNASQRGKEFSMSSRSWDNFKEFMKLVEDSSWEVS